ncbi:MAG: hypothetical protein AAI978_00365 [Candidatus Hodgkinia cicadicola]
MSFSNAFDWVSLKRFVISCISAGATNAIYNPKASYRRRLLTYVFNWSGVARLHSIVSVGKQLCTRLEHINTTFGFCANLININMLATVFVCSNTKLCIKHNNALSCTN